MGHNDDNTLNLIKIVHQARDLKSFVQEDVYGNKQNVVKSKSTRERKNKKNVVIVKETNISRTGSATGFEDINLETLKADLKGVLEECEKKVEDFWKRFKDPMINVSKVLETIPKKAESLVGINTDIKTEKQLISSVLVQNKEIGALLSEKNHPLNVEDCSNLYKEYYKLYKEEGVPRSREVADRARKMKKNGEDNSEFNELYKKFTKLDFDFKAKIQNLLNSTVGYYDDYEKVLKDNNIRKASNEKLSSRTKSLLLDHEKKSRSKKHTSAPLAYPENSLMGFQNTEEKKLPSDLSFNPKVEELITEAKTTGSPAAKAGTESQESFFETVRKAWIQGTSGIKNFFAGFFSELTGTPTEEVKNKRKTAAQITSDETGETKVWTESVSKSREKESQNLIR